MTWDKETEQLFDEKFGDLGTYRSDELNLLNFDAAKLLAIKSFINQHFVSRKQLGEGIDEYFEGLVAIPNPQATKESLKEKLEL
jgi:hypothetical protein